MHASRMASDDGSVQCYEQIKAFNTWHGIRYSGGNRMHASKLAISKLAILEATAGKVQILHAKARASAREEMLLVAQKKLGCFWMLLFLRCFYPKKRTRTETWKKQNVKKWWFFSSRAREVKHRWRIAESGKGEVPHFEMWPCVTILYWFTSNFESGISAAHACLCHWALTTLGKVFNRATEVECRQSINY